MNSKNILSYFLKGGLFAVLFIPFFVASSQLFPFISGKAFVFRILVEIIFGVWLVSMFRNRDFRHRISWISCSILIFAVVVTIADIFGASFYRSFWSNFERMDGLVSLIHIIAYFFVVSSVINTRASWYAFFNLSVVSSVLMSIYAFMQLGGLIVINQGGVRVDGTFGNATYLAVFMLFNFFIAVFLLLRVHQDVQTKKEKNFRWFLSSWYGIAMILQVVIIYHTATRGAILGLIGGLLITALIISIFDKKQLVFRKISVGVLVAVVILVGSFFFARNTDFVKQSPTLSRFSALSVKDISTQGRRYVWPMAIEGFKENPMLGWGQENFNYVFNKYYDPRMYNQEPWFDRSHNIILDWLVSGGLLGLLSYLGIFAALLALLIKNKNISVSEKAVLLGLISAYFFQNLFVFDNLISYVYFFSLLAFVHSESVLEKSTPKFFDKIENNVLITQRLLPVVIVVVVIGLIYFLNIRPIIASQNIIKALSALQTKPDQSLDYFKKVFEYDTFANGEGAEQLYMQFNRITSSNISDENKKAFVELALRETERQVNEYPNDARKLIFAGSLRSRIGDYGSALKYLEAALEESPKKQSILFELGLSYLSEGKKEEALERFKAAYELAPEYSEARILYLIGAIHNKDSQLENELVSLIGETQIMDNERIITAYASSGNFLKATEILQKRIKLQPTDPGLRFRLAAGYLQNKDRAKSLETLREIVKLFPEHKGQAEYYIKEISAGRNP